MEKAVSSSNSAAFTSVTEDLSDISFSQKISQTCFLKLDNFNISIIFHTDFRQYICSKVQKLGIRLECLLDRNINVLEHANISKSH